MAQHSLTSLPKRALVTVLRHCTVDERAKAIATCYQLLGTEAPLTARQTKPLKFAEADAARKITHRILRLGHGALRPRTKKERRKQKKKKRQALAKSQPRPPLPAKDAGHAEKVARAAEEEKEAPEEEKAPKPAKRRAAPRKRAAPKRKAKVASESGTEEEADEPATATYQIGDRVEARYQGDQWSLGKIIDCPFDDSTYLIAFDDDGGCGLLGPESIRMARAKSTNTPSGRRR